MAGWIKLHRKMVDWEWYTDAKVFRLFIHLILTVNYEYSRYRGHLIPRGSRVFGRLKLSEETGLSEQELRTALDKLKSTSEITIKSTNKFSIVTVCNYDKYQQLDNDNQPASQPSTQPTTNQPLTTSKEVKNIRSKERDSTGTKPKNGFDLSALPEGISHEIIKAFIEHRATKKAKLTQHALLLACNSAIKCQDELGITPDVALNYAIERGWSTCRPEWIRNAGVDNPKHGTPTEMDAQKDLDRKFQLALAAKAAREKRQKEDAQNAQ